MNNNDKDENIDISIIIPIFNVENYIERHIRSLFEQTIESNVEFIFVNDKTNDNSIQILERLLNEYKSRANQTIVINHESNKGLAAARNTGMLFAHGKYVIHVDSDDYFERDMLEKMYEAAKHNDADIVVADYYLTYSKSEKYIKCEIPKCKKTLIENLIIGLSSGSIGRMNWNKLIRRSLYTSNKISYINGINYNEDLVVMVPLCMKAENIIKIDRAFTHYVQSNKNSYTKKNNLLSIQNRFSATQYVSDYLTKFKVDYSHAINTKRILDKLNAIINTDGYIQQRYLREFPELSQYYEGFRYVPFYWRIPYKIALKGNLKVFNLFRNIRRLVSAIIK